MDTKASQFPILNYIEPEDRVFIITADGKNRLITAINLSSGINKMNVIGEVAGTVISLDSVSVLLMTPFIPHTLQNGSDGQEITLIGGVDDVVVDFDTSYITKAYLNLSSTITLIYVSALSKWVVKSHHNATLI